MWQTKIEKTWCDIIGKEMNHEIAMFGVVIDIRIGVRSPSGDLRTDFFYRGF
jgi:hypothetical protein